MLALTIMCPLLLIAGFVLFVIGFVKAIESKCKDTAALIWICSGNALILVSGLIAKCLNI